MFNDIKFVVFSLVIALSIASCNDRKQFNQEIITSDLDHFWQAYDKITSTQDSTLQYEYLQKLYFEKASLGLKKIIKEKRYTPQQFINVINSYPEFWKSIKSNTLNVDKLHKEIEVNILKLKTHYPELKHSCIYFAIGTFWSNGATLDSTVLIGSEMALADHNTLYKELPDHLQEFYNKNIPVTDIGLLCTHEYIHTQQNELVNNLLNYCLYEGVAEFVSTKVTGIPSYTPAIQFGKQHEQKVKQKFEYDLFIQDTTHNWLWGINKNELKQNDLGYYIGYEICERYYNMMPDKKKAIKTMIELDYTNQKEIESFIDTTQFFSSSIKELYQKSEKRRPIVTGITQFENKSKHVSPMVSAITLNFSEPMNKETRGFDFGPLGKEHVLTVDELIGFSEDGKSFTLKIKLEPEKTYQTLITDKFVSAKGIPLMPYLIDIKTSK